MAGKAFASHLHAYATRETRFRSSIADIDLRLSGEYLI